MQILFIDDDYKWSEPLRDGLAVLFDIDIDYKQTAHEAIAIFEENISLYKAIILDLWLPHYNIDRYQDFSHAGCCQNNEDGKYTGFVLLQELKTIMKAQHIEIPVILLTVLDESEVMTCLKSLNINVAKILKKPVGLQTMNDIIVKAGSNSG